MTNLDSERPDSCVRKFGFISEDSHDLESITYLRRDREEEMMMKLLVVMLIFICFGFFSLAERERGNGNGNSLERSEGGREREQYI